MEANVKLNLQRAALMAIVTVIMRSDEDTPLRVIKGAIVKSFADLIDADIMVGDEIDVVVAKTIRDFLLAEKAVSDVEDILNPSAN